MLDTVDDGVLGDKVSETKMISYYDYKDTPGLYIFLHWNSCSVTDKEYNKACLNYDTRNITIYLQNIA